MTSGGYILERAENALATHLSTSFADTTFQYYTGMDNGDKVTPCVTVQAVSADEEFLGSGVWHVAMKVYFIYPFEDSGSLLTRNTLYGNFVSHLYDTNLATSMSVSANIAVYDVYGKGQANSVQQNHWIGEHELDVVAVYKT